VELTRALIARDHGPALAADVVDLYVHSPVRAADGPQRLPVGERFPVGDARLERVLEAMEAEIETPLAAPALAALAGLSVRQLERLFARHIGRPMARHYLELRLNRARILLAQSRLSVLDIAIATGFASASHFSRAYRAAFGRPPGAGRKPGHRAVPGLPAAGGGGALMTR
jgi:transcriptional regulator GlxA family with amidase domain